MPTVATGYIAGIRYRSGRCIFCRSLPIRGQFTEQAPLAHVWPSAPAAESAAADLCRAFEKRNMDAISTFITPTDLPPDSH